MINSIQCIIRMALSINPPCFTSKSYERYPLDLLAWCEVTDISIFKHGIVIALSLQEDDENQIREKVFIQISLDDLKKGDGPDKLIKFLDTHLKKKEWKDRVYQSILLYMILNIRRMRNLT